MCVCMYYVRMYTCMYVQMHVSMYVCMHARMYMCSPLYKCMHTCMYVWYCMYICVCVLYVQSFIHSGHFYSAPSSILLLRGAPDYSTDTVSEFHAEPHRQLQVKDLPKVPTWRLERESNPLPSG